MVIAGRCRCAHRPTSRSSSKNPRCLLRYIKLLSSFFRSRPSPPLISASHHACTALAPTTHTSCLPLHAVCCDHITLTLLTAIPLPYNICSPSCVCKVLAALTSSCSVSCYVRELDPLLHSATCLPSHIWYICAPLDSICRLLRLHQASLQRLTLETLIPPASYLPPQIHDVQRLHSPHACIVCHCMMLAGVHRASQQFLTL